MHGQGSARQTVRRVMADSTQFTVGSDLTKPKSSGSRYKVGSANGWGSAYASRAVLRIMDHGTESGVSGYVHGSRVRIHAVVDIPLPGPRQEYTTPLGPIGWNTVVVSCDTVNSIYLGCYLLL